MPTDSQTADSPPPSGDCPDRVCDALAILADLLKELDSRAVAEISGPAATPLPEAVLREESSTPEKAPSSPLKRRSRSRSSPRKTLRERQLEELLAFARNAKPSLHLSVHSSDHDVIDALMNKQGPSAVFGRTFDQRIKRWARQRDLTVSYARVVGIVPKGTAMSPFAINKYFRLHHHVLIAGIPVAYVPALREYLADLSDSVELKANGSSARSPWHPGDTRTRASGIPLHLREIESDEHLENIVRYMARHLPAAEKALKSFREHFTGNRQADRALFISQTREKPAKAGDLTLPASSGTITSPIEERNTHAKRLPTAPADTATSSAPNETAGVQSQSAIVRAPCRRKLDPSPVELQEPEEHHPSGTRPSERQHRSLRGGDRVGELVARQPAGDSGHAQGRPSRSRSRHLHDDLT